MKLVVTGLALLLAVPAATATTPPTVQRTIVDANRDNLLEYGPAEPYVTRADLVPRATTTPGSPLIRFAQMTDTQLVDEESPARVEFIDRLGEAFNAGSRPQEGNDGTRRRPKSARYRASHPTQPQHREADDQVDQKL